MLSFRVLVTLSKSKIYDIDIVLCVLTASNQEIIWLDVAMDDSLLVDLLDALDELHCDHEDGLQVEVALARRKQVFERGAQQVHHHDVKLLVGHRRVSADVVEPGHARCSHKNLINMTVSNCNLSQAATYSCLAFCGSTCSPRRASGFFGSWTLSPTGPKAQCARRQVLDTRCLAEQRCFGKLLTIFAA